MYSLVPREFHHPPGKFESNGSYFKIIVIFGWKRNLKKESKKKYLTITSLYYIRHYN